MEPGDARVPCASSRPDEIGFTDLIQGSGMISKESLLAVSKGDLKRFLTSEPDDLETHIQLVHRLWRALLATMRDPSSTVQHTTAVCNAICVFLQSASTSPTPAIRAFAMAAENWMALFDALLATFETGKSKPLRQVLKSLIKILAQQDDRRRARSTEDSVLSRMATIIMLAQPASYFKASIVIFEAFIRSNIPTASILAAIGRCHGLNFDEWHQRLRRQGIEPDELRELITRYAVEQSICNFTLALILAVADSDAQAVAGTLTTSFILMLDDLHFPVDSLWALHVANVLRQSPKAIVPFKHYLLIPVFRLRSCQFSNLLHTVASDHKHPSMLQTALAIVTIGRDAELLLEADIPHSLRRLAEIYRQPLPLQNAGRLDGCGYVFFAALLTHSSVAVRIQAYDLLVRSTGAWRPMEGSSLLLLSQYLAYLHGDPDPHYRGQINEITKALIQRVRRGSEILANALTQLNISPKKYQHDKLELEQHKIFLNWLANFVEDELGPNCSFPRRSSALRALQILVSLGFGPRHSETQVHRSEQNGKPWPPNTKSHNRQMTSNLWRLLLDPYEEIRVAAASILTSLLLTRDVGDELDVGVGNGTKKCIANTQCYPGSPAPLKPESHVSNAISSLLDSANATATLTNRADHADGVGRLLAIQCLSGQRRSAVVGGIVDQLCAVLRFSGESGSLLAADFSLHGYFIGLRYLADDSDFCEVSDSGLVLKGSETSVEQLLDLCSGIWMAVRRELCIDSPEGSHDADAIGPFEGPKDYLSYAWRALRDSSLLMQSIVSKLGSETCAHRSESTRAHHLRRIYVLCFEQLTALRHRGAFSTVAQTFALCCGHMVKIPTLRTEVRSWYQNALRMLEDQSSKLTRRSAGLPAILAGILIASTPQDFEYAVGALIHMAEPTQALSDRNPDLQQICLPEVHALNCLREIFTDSRFRDWTRPWLITVLELAAASLNSKIWAIQNCGLMLFRACASRIGASYNNLHDIKTGDLSLQDEARAVLNIGMKLLEPSSQVEFESSEFIFAGLDLVSRISGPKIDRSRVRRAILVHLSSRVWLIREHAARVYAFQLPDSEVLQAAADLLCELAMNNQNRCHGVLLCARELLERHSKALLGPSPISLHALGLVLKEQAFSIQEYAAPAVQSAFVNVFNQFVDLHNHHPYPCSILPRLHPPFLVEYSGIRKASVLRTSFHQPCESHLWSSLAWNACLSVLSGKETAFPSLSQIFDNTAACDLDSAASLLTALEEKLPTLRASRSLVIEVYIHVIASNEAEDIVSIALCGLSACVDDMLRDGKDQIKSSVVQLLLDVATKLSPHGGRKVCNAVIQALGSLLRYCLTKMHLGFDGICIAILQLWLKLLDSAAKDVTEAYTRLNAAKALRGLTHGLVKRFPIQENIALSSILYDFLNDDDEEVRDLAAATVSLILPKTSTGFELPLSPLSACYRFSMYLSKSFQKERAFQLMAFSRVLFSAVGDNADAESFAALTRHQSAKAQLSLARQISHDLFEEERQNLYLDDLREIEIWTSALRPLTPAGIDRHLLSAAREWAVEGLGELTTALPSLSGGPLGVLSKHEVVTLFVRVINVADLSVPWSDGHDLGNQRPQRSPSLAGMERLLSVTRRFPMQERAQRVLEKSVWNRQLEFDEVEAAWKAHRISFSGD